MACAHACSYLINASRGSVVDLPALAAAIREGRIAGAAVDVYPSEPESNGQGFATGKRSLSHTSVQASKRALPPSHHPCCHSPFSELPLP